LFLQNSDLRLLNVGRQEDANRAKKLRRFTKKTDNNKECFVRIVKNNKKKPVMAVSITADLGMDMDVDMAVIGVLDIMVTDPAGATMDTTVHGSVRILLSEPSEP
jgi:hypothetical protein